MTTYSDHMVKGLEQQGDAAEAVLGGHQLLPPDPGVAPLHLLHGDPALRLLQEHHQHLLGQVAQVLPLHRAQPLLVVF